jgi:hypothetical protein
LYSSAAHLRAIERRTADVRALEQVGKSATPKAKPQRVRFIANAADREIWLNASPL